MAIDDPIDAALAQVESDQTSPAGETVVAVLEGCSAIGVPMTDAAAKLIKLFTRRREENVSYLLEVVIGELQRVRKELQGLSESHKRFIETEFPRLMVEAVAKAEQTGSKDRIERLGIVVVSAISRGPSDSTDLADEMLRISTALSNRDVDILVQVYSIQSQPLARSGFLPELNIVNDTWKSLQSLPDFRSPQIYGICAKLQSLGLLAQVERIPTKLDLSSIPYALLPQGAAYVEYLGRDHTATIIG
jgi:hypothetical protein